MQRRFDREPRSVPSLGRRPPRLGPPARPAQTTSLTTHTYMFPLHTPFHPRMNRTRGFRGGDAVCLGNTRLKTVSSNITWNLHFIDAAGPNLSGTRQVL